MTTALMPHDVATIVVAYLSAKMPDCSVTTRIESRNRSVRVQAAGGSRSDHVLDAALVVIQTYDPDSVQAAEDCGVAFQHLLSIRTDAEHGRYVRHVEGLGLPGDIGDPLTDEPRYQATVQLHLRPLPTGATP